MKACLVKHPYYMNWGWNSFQYSDPEQVWDAFNFKSHNMSFIIGLKADMWVIEGQIKDPAFAIDRIDPKGLAELVAAHERVPWSAVPWEDYDVVITIDPIISKKLAEKYSNILWIYNEPSHRSGRSQEAVRGGPEKPYDLYWDHYLRPSRKLKGLPQSIGLPYFTSPDIMRDLVKPTNEPAVFLDSRHVFEIPRRERHAMAHDYRNMCGLQVRHAPLDGKISRSFSRIYYLSRNRMLNCRKYLTHLGSCKYKLIWRKKAILGQGVLEAAALGLIAIGNSNGIYHKLICHPTCLIPPGGPARRGLRLIQKIEKDPDWQKEILAHQDRVLWERFWHGPLELLGRALEIKRGINA